MAQRREAQRELRQARNNVELLELQRAVIQGDRARAMQQFAGRGQPVRATPIQDGGARQVVDLGQARQARTQRRQRAEQERREREEHLRRALQTYPWEVQRMGSPLGPAEFAARARRNALRDLNRTVREISHHPALREGWR